MPFTIPISAFINAAKKKKKPFCILLAHAFTEMTKGEPAQSMIPRC